MYPSLERTSLKCKSNKVIRWPFVLFGQGVIIGEAEKEFKCFIEKSGIPAAWTILGMSALESDHYLNVGMLGMHGNYAPNILTNECDVLIAIGMRFDDRITGDLKRYATQAKVIHLEIDASEVNKNVKAHIPVVGDAKESLVKLSKLVTKKKHNQWLQKFRDLEKIEFEQVINEELNPSSDSMKMGEVIHKINIYSDQNHIIVTDVGQHQMTACRYAKIKNTRSIITSGGLGTMGFCLPAAIGAKMGKPNSEVIAVIGDGGLQMTIQELGTIFQYKTAIKIVVLNNEFLGMVRQWQEMFFQKRYASTKMINPDFQTIAKGYGIKNKKVEKRENLNTAIKEMLAHDGSYFLEVLVCKENNIFPMIPTGSSVSEIRLK